VDKPLSQERLSEDTRSDEWVDQFEFDNRTHVPMFGYVESSNLAPIIKSHRALSAEVKRLQAIEAERDRYKKTVEQILKTQELETFDDPTLLDLIYRIAKGAERVESN
jgi:hypothetical protein